VVYVTWVEENDNGVDEDIYFKTSVNNGTTFSAFQTLGGSDGNDFSDTPQLAAANDKVFLVWSENEDAGKSGAIKYVTGTGIPTDITFNQTQYRFKDTALITFDNQTHNTNALSKQNFTIQVTSTEDPVGITKLNLNETDVDTGIFSGTITFTSGLGSATSVALRILNVSAGDTISATANGDTGSSSIHAITIAFDSPGGYTIDKIANVTVTDLNSNLTTSVEFVDVTITSNFDGNTATLRLFETGGKSGKFGNGTRDSLIFMNNHTTFPLNNPITISQNNVTNDDPAALDQTTVTVSSDTDPTGTVITLTETGINTGVFTGKVTFISGATAGTSVH